MAVNVIRNDRMKGIYSVLLGYDSYQESEIHIVSKTISILAIVYKSISFFSANCCSGWTNDGWTIWRVSWCTSQRNGGGWPGITHNLGNFILMTFLCFLVCSGSCHGIEPKNWNCWDFLASTSLSTLRWGYFFFFPCSSQHWNFVALLHASTCMQPVDVVIHTQCRLLCWWDLSVVCIHIVYYVSQKINCHFYTQWLVVHSADSTKFCSELCKEVRVLRNHLSHLTTFPNTGDNF